MSTVEVFFNEKRVTQESKAAVKGSKSWKVRDKKIYQHMWTNTEAENVSSDILRAS